MKNGLPLVILMLIRCKEENISYFLIFCFYHVAMGQVVTERKSTFTNVFWVDKNHEGYPIRKTVSRNYGNLVTIKVNLYKESTKYFESLLSEAPSQIFLVDDMESWYVAQGFVFKVRKVKQPLHSLMKSKPGMCFRGPLLSVKMARSILF